jgi:hypothetical protein
VLLASLIFSFLLVVGANLIAASPAGIRGAIAFAVIAFLTLSFILSPLFFSPAATIGAFLLVIVGIVCAIKDVEFQKYLTWSLVSTGVALLCSVTFALVDLRRGFNRNTRWSRWRNAWLTKPA